MANVKPGLGETRTMKLPVALEDAEILARGKELARLKDEHTKANDELDQATTAWKSTKERIQGDIDDRDEQMRRVARVIRSGHEDRDVEVLDEPNYKTGVMATVRLDTGELVATRGLTEAERQRSLFKGEKGGAEAKGATA
jgi:hypothetical protein